MNGRVAMRGEPDYFQMVRYGIDGKELDPPLKLWEKIIFCVIAALLYPLIAERL